MKATPPEGDTQLPVDKLQDLCLDWFKEVGEGIWKPQTEDDFEP